MPCPLHVRVVGTENLEGEGCALHSVDLLQFAAQSCVLLLRQCRKVGRQDVVFVVAIVRVVDVAALAIDNADKDDHHKCDDKLQAYKEPAQAAAARIQPVVALQHHSRLE